MKSILLIVLTANFGFFLIASQYDGGGSVIPAITNTNVEVLCLAGDKVSPKCNFAAIENEPFQTKKGTSRPARRMATRSTSKSSISKSVSTKPQQLASLGKTKIEPVIATPLNIPSKPKGKVQCFTMGPFIDRDDAFNLNVQLESLNVQSVMRTVKEKERFWVYLQDYRETDQTVSALREKGVKSYKIITEKGKRDVVSFGWFKNHSSATSKYKQLASLGFTPKLTVKGSPGEQVWINYHLREGSKLPLSARKAIKRAHGESYFQEQRCK